MFSALRQGAVLYILNKGDKPELKIGYVESVTQPRPRYATYNPTVSFGTNMEQIVDIAVKIGNDKVEYSGVPSTASIHEYNKIVISESREAMISEVDGMLQNSKNIIDNVDYHQDIIKSCEDILKQLNPAYAKEQERDTAIEDLTTQVNKMQTEFGSIKGTLSKIEGLLTKAGNIQNIQTNGDDRI